MGASYLNSRTQQVIINGNESETNKVQCGVPKGSILGPLLLLIFINDLSLYLKDPIRSVDCTLTTQHYMILHPIKILWKRISSTH